MDFSEKVDFFQENYLPEKAVVLAGYTALMKAYDLKVPLPDTLAAISNKHSNYIKDNWYMYTPRYKPENSFGAHLIFALKHEGINLWILKALFLKISSQEITSLVTLEPNSIYSRKIWFLYEWLLDINLEIEDLKDTKINYIDIIDKKLQYPGPNIRLRRYRINNNLPGVKEFCPLVRRTKIIDNFIAENLAYKAGQVINRVHPDLLLRASGFLLLKDSKASYAIEGETPAQNRAERWGKAIGQAGSNKLSHKEFVRLQSIVISDFRFTHYGYRLEEGFIGEHDRISSEPIPDHISAKACDLTNLMTGLLKTDELLKDADYHPVITAAVIAFGFLFIHPFEDGNGRIHRYLIHHVLAEKDFIVNGVVFPVSAVILKNIKEYREILETYSAPRLKFIKWRPTVKNNVEVLNDTIDLYRYFDATKFTEFLFSCIKTTITDILPEEVDYLQKYDQIKVFIKNYIDMPDRMVNLLILFLQQGRGKLSRRALHKEFSALTVQEVATIEQKFQNIFNLD